MTVREALEQTAVLFDAGLVGERETARTLSYILARCPECIVYNERMEIHKITIQALAGEIDAHTFLRIMSAVLKCNGLLDRSLLTA